MRGGGRAPRVRACSVVVVLAMQLACGAALAVGSPSGYIIQQIPAPKASFLLFTWAKQASDKRSDGFQPQLEAVGELAEKLKEVTKDLSRLSNQAKLIGMAAQAGGKVTAEGLVVTGTASSESERLIRTKLVGALSVGKGSALAFVSEWPEYISIDASVVNPSYLVKSQEAEQALLRHIAEEAVAAGSSTVRLCPSFQVDGDAFYEECGFYRVEVSGEGDTALAAMEYRSE